MENYRKTISKQFEIVEYCIQKGNSISASILMYSMIDSFSWLCNINEKKQVSERFMSWVDDWLIPTGYPKCSSTDLYGARCGLIHRLTGESNFYESGKAKLIVYTYGNENPEYITSFRSEFPEHADFYSLHLEKFMEAIEIAMNNCFDHCMKNEELKMKLIDKMEKIFVDIELLPKP